MALPDYGAAPLAKTFMLTRGLALFAMVCIVGLTANFVSEIVSTNTDPPREIISTLAIVRITYIPQKYPLGADLSLDLRRRPVLPDQHSLLLCPRQSWSVHHGWC